MNHYTAYTDGSASTKGEKLGGFGVYIINEDTGEEQFHRKGFINTKTGRMELKAMIHLLKVIDKNSLLYVYADSEYVVKCITDRRLWNWKRCDWIGIKNPDLMKQFYEEFTKFRIHPKVFHIKGHTNFDDSNSLGNSIADKLADYKTQESYEVDIV